MDNDDDDDYSSLPSRDNEFSSKTKKSAVTKTASALMVAASAKAGMDDIDRERINAILLRESGNSSFMERQRKMDEASNKRIVEMKQRLAEKDNTVTNKKWRIEMEKNVIDPQLEKYTNLRKPLSTCVVIDMDSFFISCHILNRPNLADIPACVGGSSMISTSNYVARRYGVRAAMPGYLGSTLVKELSGGNDTLTFVKSDFNLYKRKSAEVEAILEEYDPKLKMYSLDEAYMDISPYLNVKMNNDGIMHQTITKILNSADNTSCVLRQPPLHETFPGSIIHTNVQNLLQSIREKVKDTTGLTCSAGIASNFLLAKIASDINKPNGQYFVGPTEQQIRGFIQPLSIRKVNGIGRVTEKTLYGVCGIEKVKDLFDKRADVQLLFKPATANFLLRASIGYADCNKHREDARDDEAIHRKGISHERTFSPTNSWSDLCNKLETITLSLVQDLRKRALMPRTVTLKVKLSSFDILTRAETRNVAFDFKLNKSYSASAQDLVDVAINLLKDAKRDRDKTAKGRFTVRLLGVRCSNFLLHKENQFFLHEYCQIPSQSTTVPNPYEIPKRDTAASSTNGSANTTSSSNEGKMANFVSLQDEAQTCCPICNKTFHPNQNHVLNAHIDACLNASTVKELCKEETVSADERAKKKQKRTLNDFFVS